MTTKLGHRPLSQAEKRDIVLHTEHLLARLRDHSLDGLKVMDADLNKASEYATKATVRLIYVGFGFKIMRENMADESARKAFVRKHFPTETENADRYVAI